ncbi:hypothetical protein C471_09030 [Halorubrum saccharovorum DSM 1137]|uniref:Uncharacterized protein n=1 Tax=Halorubrum saccharovorum DSM 1137 TaxID=1227484 RepID=M0DYD4_9EURY|nr:hypothetical protein C471_09030 [Halorubrum saccharovorum DSM 1137]
MMFAALSERISLDVHARGSLPVARDSVDVVGRGDERLHRVSTLVRRHPGVGRFALERDQHAVPSAHSRSHWISLSSAICNRMSITKPPAATDPVSGVPVATSPVRK